MNRLRFETKTKTERSIIPQQVLYPAITEDYRLENCQYGLAVVANRNFKKGDIIFGDSIEFTFEDVHDGDQLYLYRNNQASRKAKTKIPPTFALNRDVLLRTHGGPFVKPGGTAVSWKLEVPGMLINHSCNPNVKDDNPDDEQGEARAARDIRKGEELTYDYALQFYHKGPKIEECLCGSTNCRGSMMGFKALPLAEQKRLLPEATQVVRAMYLADHGLGPKVNIEQTKFPPRGRVEPSGKKVMRLVFPGPSYSLAKVTVTQNEARGRYELRALKNFKAGEKVYEFWRQFWPHKGEVVVDMVFASNVLEGDPAEGTVVRVDPQEYGAPRDRRGRWMFSGWDLFTKHSCDPNMAYDDYYEDEDDDWHIAYAVKEIQKGDVLTVDWNCLLWDRTANTAVLSDGGTCHCGSPRCTGTVKGFKYLSPQAKQERKSMSYLRVLPPNYDELDVTPGEALSSHVRAMWRKYSNDAPCTGTSSSSSDSESSSSESSSWD